MQASLVRTPGGLANLHLFHKSDYIIYCESHPGCPQGMSWDVGFWQKIFVAVSPQLTFTFKPQGSKSQINKISASLAGQTGHKSICCVDRDFDDIHNLPQVNAACVRTYGYAFENDLCDPDIISSAIDTSLPGFTDLAEIRKQFSQHRSTYGDMVRRAVLLDQILSFYFLSFFDRENTKFRAVFDVPSAHGPVSVSKIRLRTRWRLQRQRAELGRPVGKRHVDDDCWRRMLGHLCWWLNYRIARTIMVGLGHDGRMSEDSFAATCLLFFGVKLSDPSWNVRIYYDAAVTDALVAAS